MGIDLLRELVYLGPWKKDQREYWSQIELGVKGQYLSPFKLYRDEFNFIGRTAHEVAHLVVAKDEDITDPFWGIPHFLFNSKKLPRETGLIEASVLPMSYLLSGFDHNFAMARARFDLIDVFSDSVRAENLSHEEVCENIIIWTELWTPERIRAEALRKYSILEKMGYHSNKESL